MMFKRNKKVTDHTKSLIADEAKTKLAEYRATIEKLNCKIDCYISEHLKKNNEIIAN